MNKLILKDIKEPKDLSNYIFARGGIKIEGEVDIGCDYYGNHLGCEYTDISLYDDILVLEKDKIITDDEVFDYYLKREKSSPSNFIPAYCGQYILKYAILTDDGRNYNIVKIFCDEYFAFLPNEFCKMKELEYVNDKGE